MLFAASGALGCRVATIALDVIWQGARVKVRRDGKVALEPSKSPAFTQAAGTT
jgi:hypothetical protein